MNLAANVTVAGLEFVTTGTRSPLETVRRSRPSRHNLQAGSGISGTIGVAIVGAGDVTATGPGTVILTGANTYSGGTTISGGISAVRQRRNQWQRHRERSPIIGTLTFESLR